MRAACRRGLVLLALLPLLVVACGGAGGSRSPAPAGTASAPAPSPPADLTQVEAVGYQIFPHGPSTDCFDGGFDKCPFSPRLTARMQEIVNGFDGPGADPVCRCQNSYTASSVAAAVVSGRPVGQVVLEFGDGSTTRMTWLFVQSAGGWQADDSYCTVGGPSTSIYVNTSTLNPCPG